MTTQPTEAEIEAARQAWLKAQADCIEQGNRMFQLQQIESEAYVRYWNMTVPKLQPTPQ